MNPITNLLISALHERVVVMIKYHGFNRYCEVHAIGKTKSGRLVARVWQIEGGSESGSTQGWKLFTVDEISRVSINHHVPSMAPRSGYKMNDRQMSLILAQVELSDTEE